MFNSAIFLHIIQLMSFCGMVAMALRISTVIRETRKEKGLTQEGLAELIGVTPGYVGQLERNETTPSAVILSKIVEVLGIDANSLFFEQTEAMSLSREIAIRASRLSKENQEIVLGIINIIEQAYRKRE